ncbi:spore coat protein [Paenibacillus sp. FSL H8-0548]|uniref:spore coat protein n=1 Tax=Paenibacillus sp. FSL H8-0548 TaxID=1920422 RepID=UPI00096E75AC|nr:spore coat protein [Paenibacillus sp. FSL H8-0548]OMF35966.1 spore coat protein [Paenibacillus sp. FSL H8-0548]
MYQQQQQSQQSFLTEEDLVSTILCDLKRVVREYATAATESTCPDIRQMFTKLMDSTLTLQGKLFEAMKQANMYNTSSPALRQELDKQAKQYQQTKQKTNQFLQQNLGQQQNKTMYTPNMQQQSNQPQGSQHYYM